MSDSHDLAPKKARLDTETEQIFGNFNVENFQKQAIYSRMVAYKELCSMLELEKSRVCEISANSEGTCHVVTSEISAEIKKINEQHLNEVIIKFQGIFKNLPTKAIELQKRTEETKIDPQQVHDLKHNDLE
jgi:hypothetical protein